MDKKQGIYKIINKINKKYYVGSSDNIFGRWNSHKSLLRRKTHENPHLQSAWKKHGKDSFDFIIVEKVEKGKLLEVEQKYLDIARQNPHSTYNINFVADKPPMNNEIKLKISKANKGKLVGEKNPWYYKGRLMVGEKNPNYNNSIYKFHNKNTQENFGGTQQNFYKKYNLDRPSISNLTNKKRKSCHGWILVS